MKIATRQKSIVRRMQLFVAAAVLALSSLAVLVPQTALAAGEDFTVVANKTAAIGDMVPVTDLQITGTGDDALSLTLHASAGTLDFSAPPAASVNGEGTGTVVLEGTRSELNAALATLEYTATTVGAATIKADLGNNVGNVIWNDGPGGNGHAYIVVNQNMTWQNAAATAETYTFGGQQGYLATITDAVENNFVYNAINQQTGWIGANDIASEGAWYWQTGPEAGTQFWSGNYAGSPVGGQYSNWQSGVEPNNSAGNEDCGQFWTGGTWNDIPCNTPRPFVVEFGDGVSPLAPITTEFTVTVTAATQNIATCEQLTALGSSNAQDTINLTADIDCAGQTVEPLFEGATFTGVFEGGSHTIRNVTIDQPSSQRVGLLGAIDSATIQNLTLENFTITGDMYVGALAGYASDGVTISDVHVRDATVHGENGRVGGLIGEYELYGTTDISARIQRVSVVGGQVTSGDAGNIGGLIGEANVDSDGAGVEVSFLIQKTFTDIAVSSTTDSSSADAGGLIGDVSVYSWGDANWSNFAIYDTYTWGDVSVPLGENIGGLVGRAGIDADSENATANLTITRTYAKGNITGEVEVGGLIGQLSEVYLYGPTASATYEITNNFAMGKVTTSPDEEETHYRGGLIGRSETFDDEVIVTGNYYDAHRTGQTVCATAESSTDPIDCTAVNIGNSQPNYFLDNTTNAPLNTWDFATVWVKNTNVPPTFAPFSATDDNGDGIPDVQQNNVASFTSPVNGKRMVLQLSDTCDITNASAAAESDTTKDAGYIYEGGLISFDADCTGGSTEVVLYQYGVSADGIVARKFDPTRGYFTIDSAAISTVNINGKLAVKAVYTIIDDGALDLDKTPGKISDPVGLGQLVGAPRTGLGGRN